ncbi:MAG: ABC transporter substrate-binding protein, partial [Acidimicrobiales bacterium]
MFTGKKKGLVGAMAVVLAGAMIVPLLAISSATATTRVSHALPAPPTATPSQSNTIYTSGTMYGPPNVFNPNESGSYATGTEGLVYETLWLYDPVKNDYIPWLAKGGVWTSPTSYRILLRSGVKWSDGTPLTATDVAFTIDLAKTDPGIYYSNLAADIASVTVNNPLTVTVSFKHVSAEDWQSFLYQDPILPQHIMGTWSNTEMNTGSNPDPVGSGPMLVDDSLSNLTQVCYYNNPSWWATAALGLKFKFTYLCDELNSSNNVELEDMLAGELTLSNNFLPGIASLISSPASTGNLGGKGGYGGF